MAYYMGVDVGSLSTDVVVIDENAKIAGSAVTMTGGVAKNQGVLALFAESLGETPSVADEPQLVGALGAALIAKQKNDLHTS